MAEIIEGLVSTIIPVYNRPKLLSEAVGSVLAQTYRPIEIIISDDGSTDETPLVGRELAETHPGEIFYIHNKNRGAGPAREAGRRLAKGEFIQYLDSDDRLLPRKFEIQVKALREHPECGAAYGCIRFCPEDGPPRPEPYKWSGRELPTLFPWLLADRWWNTDCPLFRRTVTDAVGPWTDLRYSQDWEYDARIGALGTRLVHCKEFVCEQRHHGELRQTGGSKWLPPADRVRFFTLLYQHALRAGTGLNAPEMKHFVRWVFFNVRQCGILGDATAARELFSLAVKASGRATVDMRAYRLLAGIFGWTSAARVAEKGRSFISRTPGQFTRKQSWMEADAEKP
ncbi:MAG: glycosyltransferase family 2 protein [Thermodesulfovibrionales bacterium]